MQQPKVPLNRSTTNQPTGESVNRRIVFSITIELAPTSLYGINIPGNRRIDESVNRLPINQKIYKETNRPEQNLANGDTINGQIARNGLIVESPNHPSNRCTWPRGERDIPIGRICITVDIPNALNLTPIKPPRANPNPA